MQNVLLSRKDFNSAKEWLRSTEIVWRDVGDAALVPSWNEAIVNKECCNENGLTPGQVGYASVCNVYPRLSLRWRKDELGLLELRPPKLFTSDYSGEMFGLDLSHAYHQLYTRLFLHSDWPRKRQKYPLFPVAEQLAEASKSARNSIVGITRSTTNKWCQGSKVWYVKKKNRYLSPTLWGQLMMITNEIAHKMIELGAIYVNTDGYVFDDFWASRIAEMWLQDNQLEYSCFTGEGEILGISTVFIPGIKEPGELNSSKPTRHLETLETGWVDWWNSLKRED